MMLLKVNSKEVVSQLRSIDIDNLTEIELKRLSVILQALLICQAKKHTPLSEDCQASLDLCKECCSKIKNALKKFGFVFFDMDEGERDELMNEIADIDSLDLMTWAAELENTNDEKERSFLCLLRAELMRRQD